ncbi:MAG: MoaD/ThiS family protein [Acidimicrobiia bacterium]|jgi:molybdopterin converting factor small subunit
MKAVVKIPTSLRGLTGGSSIVEVPTGRLSEVITSLTDTYPELGERLLDEAGDLRRFVNVFVDDDDIRFLDHLETTVSPGQVVTILPAVAGG